MVRLFAVKHDAILFLSFGSFQAQSEDIMTMAIYDIARLAGIKKIDNLERHQ
jgi:hypothetical protein